MSWGYFAELDVTLPTDALGRLRRKKPSDFVLARGWSGLREEGLEAAFGRRLTTNETFAKTLGWFRPGGSLPSVRREETSGERAALRVLTMLEKSLLDHAFPLAALFHAVRDEGGAGTFRLVSDGTSDGEPGVELTIVGGEITKRRLEPDWELTGRFGAELFAPNEEVEAAPPAKKKPTATANAAKKEEPKPARAKTSAPKKTGAVDADDLFARFVENDGLAWLCAGRSLDEVMKLVDGEATESSLGLLRYVHYRRSASTLAPATAAEPAVRVSLHGRDGVITKVVLALGGDPNEGPQLPDDEVARVGDAWRARVTALGKRLEMKRTEAPKRGAVNQRLTFRGVVERVGVGLEWGRSVTISGGKIVAVTYQVLVHRL